MVDRSVWLRTRWCDHDNSMFTPIFCNDDGHKRSDNKPATFWTLSKHIEGTGSWQWRHKTREEYEKNTTSANLKWVVDNSNTTEIRKARQAQGKMSIHWFQHFNDRNFALEKRTATIWFSEGDSGILGPGARHLLRDMWPSVAWRKEQENTEQGNSMLDRQAVRV